MSEANILEEAGLNQIKNIGIGRVITPEMKEEAEELGFSFYDGERKTGYGGYYYDGRWQKVAEVMRDRYGLNKNSKILIDRCHKGFLVYDLKKLIPGITVYGIHPKPYAITHAMDGFGRWALLNGKGSGNARRIEEDAAAEIIPFLLEADSRGMPFQDNYFDTTISIEHACSFPELECRKVIREIIRTSKDKGQNCYVQNDSWRNESEKNKLMNWSLLCKTFLSITEWERMFKEEGYNGDWGFTIIQ